MNFVWSWGLLLSLSLGFVACSIESNGSEGGLDLSDESPSQNENPNDSDSGAMDGAEDAPENVSDEEIENDPASAGSCESQNDDAEDCLSEPESEPEPDGAPCSPEEACSAGDCANESACGSANSGDDSESQDTPEPGDGTDSGDPDDEVDDPEDVSAPSETNETAPCEGGPVNPCGGCEVLQAELGEACGTCGSGEIECATADTLYCKGDEGVDSQNECGGCSPLEELPGSLCGPCHLDAFVCAGEELTVCGSYTFGNACGGCEPLEDDPGEPCGECDGSVWTCESEGILTCQELDCSCNGASPHLWRVAQNSVDASNWFVAELEFYAFESGGSDLTSPGLAMSQAMAARNPERAHLAFDNNSEPGNNWGEWYVPDMLAEQLCDDGAGGTAICPVPENTDWLGWDFGEGVTLERVHIKQFGSDSVGDIWGYTSLLVQSSCDGIQWRDEWTMNDLPTDGTWASRARSE